MDVRLDGTEGFFMDDFWANFLNPCDWWSSSCKREIQTDDNPELCNYTHTCLTINNASRPTPEWNHSSFAFPFQICQRIVSFEWLLCREIKVRLARVPFAFTLWRITKMPACRNFTSNAVACIYILRAQIVTNFQNFYKVNVLRKSKSSKVITYDLLITSNSTSINHCQNA